jgi:multiple sugar transport system substrate-binding protein
VAITLCALGWDHERCMAPMRAAAREWSRLHPKVEIEWHIRSGLAFAQQPLEEVAPFYDVISIDHPFVGAAASGRTLVPLDEVLAPAKVEQLAADAIGASHRSYEYDGHLWALATDAACQVSVVRPDLLAEVPKTWEDVLALGREVPGRVTASLESHQAMCSFLSLCASFGAPALATENGFADPQVGRAAIEWLLAFSRVCHPGAWEDFVPERMSRSDDCLYCPLQFGFTNYSRRGFEGRRLRFADIPSSGGGTPFGSCLGGAGLAVSAASTHIAEAAAFAAWATTPAVQAEVVFPNGGQPGSRGVWTDPSSDEAAGAFFSGTLATIEGAVVRPTDPWWPSFQRDGGRALSRGLRAQHDAEAILADLESLWQHAIAAAVP